jgi:hypothetical protein
MTRQREEGALATAAYLNERAERVEKTARLRALRLAKEATDLADADIPLEGKAKSPSRS